MIRLGRNTDLGDPRHRALLPDTLHLLLTYFSAKFVPRDATLTAHMQCVSPAISPQTTLWRARVALLYP